ncbi:DUF4355 domain-containing protein [Weissella coleopterorum]|uniref:DUF4355 domain-containing protein n=1 Tax=Weissella coleopterorum TaxID=2714949 RepID=A0A6G8AYR5_9LACO|nr:DUF4355 domain-containing protein [Weissella coleopterorum]QIL50105.1 DUF4355 domain-containing protein [Weissella coleopterorum]
MADEPNNGNGATQGDGEITFTEEQQVKVDELIGVRLDRQAAKNADATQQAISEAKAKWEAEAAEKAKLDKMPEDQRKKHEQEVQNKQLEAANAEKESLQQELNHLNMVNAASSLLADKGMVADEAVLQFVVRENADSTQQAVDDFVKLVEDKAEAKRQESLKGSTPKLGNSNGQGKSFGTLAAERTNQQNNTNVADDFFGVKK